MCFEFGYEMKEKEVNQFKDISTRTINSIERKEKHINILLEKFNIKE